MRYRFDLHRLKTNSLVQTMRGVWRLAALADGGVVIVRSLLSAVEWQPGDVRTVHTLTNMHAGKERALNALCSHYLLLMCTASLFSRGGGCTESNRWCRLLWRLVVPAVQAKLKYSKRIGSSPTTMSGMSGGACVVCVGKFDYICE